MSIKIVATADNHLHAYYAKMNPQQQEARRRRLRMAFQAAVDFAIEQKADIFLQAGDLFDVLEPRNLELVFVASQLKRLQEANLQTFLISGTHDSPKHKSREEATPQRIFAALGYVQFFDSRVQVEPKICDIGDIRVAVGGISTDCAWERGSDPFEALRFSSANFGDFNLLMIHSAIEGYFSYPVGLEPFIRNTTIERIEGINCIIAGHLHRHAYFKIADKHIIIPGATERLNFGEINNSTGFYFIQVESASCIKLDYIPIAPQPMKELIISATELLEEKDPTAYILNKVVHQSNPEQLFKLKLTGELPKEQFHKLSFSHLWHLGNMQNFYFELDTSNLIIESADASIGTADIGATFSQKEELRCTVEEKLKKSKDDVERSELTEALKLILSELEKLT